MHREAEKRTHFSFVNKSFNMQRNLTKFDNLIVDEYYHRVFSALGPFNDYALYKSTHSSTLLI